MRRVDVVVLVLLGSIPRRRQQCRLVATRKEDMVLRCLCVLRMGWGGKGRDECVIVLAMASKQA